MSGRPADEESGRSSTTIKRCCAEAYDHQAVRVLVGDSMHPGGAPLTERLGRILNLGPQTRVLDVATGRGTSALIFAARFGCHVVGLDYSQRNVELARHSAREQGLSDRVTFYSGDAERMPFADGTFDAVICECALCTFPDKRSAVAEFARVLGQGGRVGISDLTRRGSLPSELKSLEAWIACVADARTVEEYSLLFAEADLNVGITEAHDQMLIDFVERIRLRLLAVEIMVGLKKIDLPGIDLAIVNDIARHALTAAKAGKIGYAIVTATKDSDQLT